MSVVGRQWQLAVDPSAAGFDANIGECAINTSTGTRYVKTGAATTAWTVDTSAYGGGGPPTAHATTHQLAGSDQLALDASLITAGTVATARLGSGAASAANCLLGNQTWGTTPADSIRADFTVNLGVAKRSGTFDITGLAGLTPGNTAIIVQTAQAIASKGNARDEPQFDPIIACGYVVDAATIRCHWRATGVVVGTYAFLYQVGA